METMLEHGIMTFIPLLAVHVVPVCAVVSYWTWRVGRDKVILQTMQKDEESQAKWWEW